MQDVWKFAVDVNGALSVMTSGITLMLKLYVISWALQEQVCHYDRSYVIIIIILLSNDRDV